ncbi:unnamed protein product [Nippostrongylus brasiliensis]|uniref:Transposase n=1 Tax=Nippostrongylus brasiliensis TaxID=27835 RepID=A0A0N4XGK5_NIPBR|nr:unnamed protein product [Nippostrongylus brasiliensis]
MYRQTAIKVWKKDDADKFVCSKRRPAWHNSGEMASISKIRAATADGNLIGQLISVPPRAHNCPRDTAHPTVTGASGKKQNSNKLTIANAGTGDVPVAFI